MKTSLPTNPKPAEARIASTDAMEARLRGYQSRVQAVLDAVLPTADVSPHRLHAAQRYAVLGGGKRLRPLLVYCTGEALGVDAGALDAPAAAVELIHSYSLIHDDLPAMDDDDLRRGQPTTHRAFDEATAILAGDALQVLAFSLLARDRAAGVSSEARLKMIQILADASGTAGMAGGQALDLAAVGRHLDLEELEAMHRLKTGALIRASVLLAAACAPDLTPAEWEALDGYSQDIGLAFQIQDDILDVEGNIEDLGKTIGADAARAKPTYPSVLGAEAAKLRARELQCRACDRLALFGGRAGVLAWLAAWVVDRRV
ncbi:MAG TPA: farnesyl diphosphate synthase [Steroidobacteraceae bacterium]|nr:farnesyl diphosphate synthase [Steroidobacteraceae bacterium]